MRARLLSFAALCAVGHAQAEARWFVRAGDAGARIVGAAAHGFAGVAPAPVVTPAGDYAIHFGRSAVGKPDSLLFSVPAGATVAAAVEDAPAVAPLVLEAGADYRVVGTATAAGSTGRLGLVARRLDDDSWYRFVWDRERAEFRLERAMGGDLVLLGATRAPVADELPHELALQVEGFRLRAWFDDVLVLQALDGAHTSGAWQTFAEGDLAVRWRAVAVEPPAAPRPSSVLVTADGEATLTAATCAPGGHFGVVELSLDRPHAALPMTAAGLELWLLQRPAAPRILLGDMRGELGDDVVAELPPDGRLRCGLRWPRGRWFFAQAALVRVLAVTPDGDRILSRTPAVSVAM